MKHAVNKLYNSSSSSSSSSSNNNNNNNNNNTQVHVRALMHAILQ